MARILLFLVQLAVLVAAAVWIADRPGEVRIRWLGREITADVGVLILAVFLLMLLAAVGYHLWRRLLRAPGLASRAFDRGRRRRGLQALTNGLVAVAAGEADEARRWSRKADQLLDEPALTQLLAAQVADLDGDRERARALFDAMLARPETRFLGLRGLVQQALAEGDTQAALGYVEEAHRLRPDTPWVLDTLFDLAERDGRLAEAGRVLTEARRRGVLKPAEADRRRAVVLLEESQRAEQSGDAPAALDRAKQALRLAPELTAAALRAARLAAHLGKPREGERLLERAWTVKPHPALAELYLGLARAGSAAERLKLLRRLTGGQPDQTETRLALAGAAAEAGQWAEARQLLAPHEAAPPDQRFARLLALLAEAEAGDAGRARHWRDLAASLPPPPVWTCGSCGQAQAEWQPRCIHCGAFDALAWKPGPVGLAATLPAPAPAAAPQPPAPPPAAAPAPPPAPAPAPAPAPPPAPPEPAPTPAPTVSKPAAPKPATPKSATPSQPASAPPASPPPPDLAAGGAQPTLSPEDAARRGL